MGTVCNKYCKGKFIWKLDADVHENEKVMTFCSSHVVTTTIPPYLKSSMMDTFSGKSYSTPSGNGSEF